MAHDPAACFPAEVWREVLLWGSAIDPDFGLTVSHVAKRWRDDALQEASLWRRFVVRGGAREGTAWFRSLPNRAEAWMSRSRGLLQEVSLILSPEADYDAGDDRTTMYETFDAEHRLVRVLAPAMTGVVNLDIEADSALVDDWAQHWLPLCKEIESLTLAPLESSVQGLEIRLLPVSVIVKHLTISGPHLGVTPDDSPWRWQQLKSLTLRQAVGNKPRIGPRTLRMPLRRFVSRANVLWGFAKRINSRSPGPDEDSDSDQDSPQKDTPREEYRMPVPWVMPWTAEGEAKELPLLALLRRLPLLEELRIADEESADEEPGISTYDGCPPIVMPMLRVLSVPPEINGKDLRAAIDAPLLVECSQAKSAKRKREANDELSLASFKMVKLPCHGQHQ